MRHNASWVDASSLFYQPFHKSILISRCGQFIFEISMSWCWVLCTPRSLLNGYIKTEATRSRMSNQNSRATPLPPKRLPVGIKVIRYKRIGCSDWMNKFMFCCCCNYQWSTSWLYIKARSKQIRTRESTQCMLSSWYYTKGTRTLRLLLSVHFEVVYWKK